MPSEHLSWKQEPSSLHKLPETLVLLCPESLLSFKPSRGVREGNQQKLKFKFLKITPSLAEKIQQVKMLCMPGGPEFEPPAHINQVVLRRPYECWSMLFKVQCYQLQHGANSFPSSQSFHVFIVRKCLPNIATNLKSPRTVGG